MTNLRIRIRHLHEGNSSLEDREGSAFVTIAATRLISENNEKIILRTRARCRAGDRPSRAYGRVLASCRLADLADELVGVVL